MTETATCTYKTGTCAGYQWHRLTGTEACEACKAANRKYMRQYRAQKPHVVPEGIRRARIRNRALSRLAAHHPVEYSALLAEEDQRDAEGQQ